VPASRAAPAGAVPLLTLSIASQHRLPLQALSQLAIMGTNLLGCLVVHYSAPLQQAQQAAFQQLAAIRGRLRPAFLLDAGRYGWSPDWQQAPLPAADAQLAAAHTMVFVTLATCFVAPLYLRAMLELKDKLSWAQARQLQVRLPQGLGGSLLRLLMRQGCSWWACVLAHAAVLYALAAGTWVVSDVLSVALGAHAQAPSGW
jgi:hypothetical protein